MQQLDQYPLWTAMVTPFDDQGEIDFVSFGNLIKRQQEAGNAVLVLGSTGEALALSLEEKKQVVQFVNDLQLSVPVMVGVGGFRLQDQLEWVEFCNQQDHIQALLLVTPLYAKPAVKGQTKWFQALLDQARYPCMLYNIPSRTGVSLYPEVLTNLQEHPQLWALKEGSGTVDDFRDYQLAAPEFPLYSGNDSLMLRYTLMGGKGLVSVAANVWPEATKLYVEKILAGQDEQLLPFWKEACDTLFQVTNPIPVKALLYKKQWIKSPVLKLPLTHEDIQDIDQLVNMDQAIANWLQQESK